MFIRRAMRMLVAAMALLLPLVAVQLVAAPGAAAAPAAPAPLVRVLYYDTSQAAEFVSNWDTGARIWNETVKNVRLEKVRPGVRANIRITADNGWPRAYVTSLGNGTVVMGRQAVNQGYFKDRIAAHELGHILGLPDRRTGLCSDLMSGSSAPVSCQNARPSAAEAAQVERNFQGSLVHDLASTVAAQGFDECYVPTHETKHVF